MKKAYEALEIYDYFKAKKNFEKAGKKDVPPASYGLATILHRNDNPFHDTYLAYQQIIRLDTTYFKSKEKHREKWTEFGVNPTSINQLKQEVSGQLFAIALKKNKSKDYQHFIDSNSWSVKVHEAVRRRDELEFADAKNTKTAYAMEVFLKSYPESHLYNDGLKIFHQLQYEEATESDYLTDYIAFIEKNPTSPYVSSAQNEIFKIETKNDELNAYESFIAKYPDNRNIDSAWKMLYAKYSANYTEDRIEQFLKKYPKYPFKQQVLDELALFKEMYYPVKSNGFWGYENREKEIKIKPEYDFVGLFDEGLAMVEKDELYGFINKKGEVVVPIKYEEAESFSDGLAVVSLDDKLGVVNRLGGLVLGLGLEDVGRCANNLFYAKVDSFYHFYKSSGHQMYFGKYEEIYSFNGKTAIFLKDGKYGVLDMVGSMPVTIVTPNFERIYRFGKDKFKCQINGDWVVMNQTRDTLTKQRYDAISEFSEGLAYVEKDGFYGYIDTSYQEVLPIQFPTFDNSSVLAQFKNSSARVIHRGKMGLIDKTGKKIVPSIFKFCGNWADLIPIQKVEKWGYCNQKINRVIDYQFQQAEPFVGDKAIVEFENQMGVIDVTGAFVLPAEYSKLYWKGNYLFARTSTGEWFVFDKNLKKLNQKGALAVYLVSKNRYVLEFESNSKMLTLEE